LPAAKTQIERHYVNLHLIQQQQLHREANTRIANVEQPIIFMRPSVPTPE